MDAKRRRKAERKGRELALNEGIARSQRGKVYDVIRKLELFEPWDAGDLTYADVRDHLLAEAGLDVTRESVVVSLQAMSIDRRFDELADEWTIDPEIRDMLALDPPNIDDEDAFDEWLHEAALRFKAFRDRFFRTSRGPFLTKEFHLEWIREILRAILTGGQLQILAPPRHGKSELLIHFAVWLIARNPNIRILWVGPNGDISGDMATSVKNHLEHNEDLIKAVLPPGHTFVPHRGAGKEWKATKFTVAPSNIVGQKSSTMNAIGRNGKILSRDVDLIVADDIEDHDSTKQPTPREETRKWFLTQLDSRKEEHTAWVTIGSRQHADDLYGYLLESDEWESIVNSAHDVTCQIPDDEPQRHVECMLFPELRSFRWLVKKKRAAFTMNQEDLYEMVYMNNPIDEGEHFWTRELVANAYNFERGLEKPKDTPLYLVGGLDPSATGHQGAYLAGVELYTEQPREYMIDLDNRVGGGVGPFCELARYWHAKYGLRHWVIEHNLYRTGFLDAPQVLELQAELKLIIEPHETQGNKNDPWFGVGAMRMKFELPPVESNEPQLPRWDLPMGTPEAQQKVEILARQMVNFSTTPQSNRRKTTDVLMAAWFPQKVIRRIVNEYLAALDAQESQPHDLSFAGYDEHTYEESPW